MIKISLDEGFVFDLLSINEVKLLYVKDPQKLQTIKKARECIVDEIVKQIGLEKFETIVNSIEYKSLFEANRKTFELVDEVKNDRGLAKRVDESNYYRYTCKSELQKSFFNEPITETKIGY
jgi:uncharacterized membrane-anchored protein YjiN (DUF445 family)